MQPSDPEEKGPWSKMPYAKVQTRRSTMISRSQLDSWATDPCNTRRSEGIVRRSERKTSKEEGNQQVFIPRESGGWGDAGRLARRGQAKPERVALDLEAGRGAHFTRTIFIF